MQICSKLHPTVPRKLGEIRSRIGFVAQMDIKILFCNPQNTLHIGYRHLVPPDWGVNALKNNISEWSFFKWLLPATSAWKPLILSSLVHADIGNGGGDGVSEINIIIGWFNGNNGGWAIGIDFVVGITVCKTDSAVLKISFYPNWAK